MTKGAIQSVERFRNLAMLQVLVTRLENSARRAENLVDTATANALWDEVSAVKWAIRELDD